MTQTTTSLGLKTLACAAGLKKLGGKGMAAHSGRYGGWFYRR